MKRSVATIAVVALLVLASPCWSQTVLIEAESFDDHGGWSLDTQFIQTMGSPYLLAHGLGVPVKDATTTVKIPTAGKYHVWVRTFDWVARWKAPGQPGRFQLVVDGKPLAETFGTKGADWTWQNGGTVELGTKATLALHDLTGFDGRCDAICFTRDDNAPPNASDILPAWRREVLGLPANPTLKSGYDLVVIGGGYAGVGSALSAARMGCKVALIQDRGVLGGNGSSEVRVWAMGNIKRGRYPHIGEIIEEISDHAKASPAPGEQFEDAKREAVVRAEKKIDLFLFHHAFAVEKDGNRITAVTAFDTRTSDRKKFTGRLFADCTGHGTIGFLAGADTDTEPKGRMGMSNMWSWDEKDGAAPFPETPWALDLNMKDFPYPRDHHAEWFWESGFDKDAIKDAEAIRDHNLRAAYGAFNAMKNRDGADKHKKAYMTWLAYIGGPRESRRLLGDVVLTEEDIVKKKDFTDGCVPSTWSIDLHYPRKQYAGKFPDDPFISIAVHDGRVDKAYGYPVPYRCFYSRNIENLFMAGRDISVTHEALGTTRVMKTCGMMGEVVGKASSICVKHDCVPRTVYADYWPELDELLQLPGKARRASVQDKIDVPAGGKNSAPLTITGLDPKKLDGLVIDDLQAKRTGKWTEGSGLAGFVGDGYQYATPNSGAKMRYEFKAPDAGTFDVRISFQPHPNRGKTVPVTIESAAGTKTVRVDQSQTAPLEHGFLSIGRLTLRDGEAAAVTIGTEGAGGLVHADAVQIVRVP
jgi:FAD dependent oxidoreductase